MVSRTSPPTSSATWNIVGTSRIDGLRSSGTLVRSSSRLTTDWVVPRLPAVNTVITRSPGTDHWCILRKTEMLSTPEFVRVSDMKTSPRSSCIPTQYVTAALPVPAAPGVPLRAIRRRRRR